MSRGAEAMGRSEGAARDSRPKAADRVRDRLVRDAELDGDRVIAPARGPEGARGVSKTLVPARDQPAPRRPTETEAVSRVRSHRIAFAIVLAVTPNSTAIE